MPRVRTQTDARGTDFFLFSPAFFAESLRSLRKLAIASSAVGSTRGATFGFGQLAKTDARSVP